MKLSFMACLLTAFIAPVGTAQAKAPAGRFESTGADKAAIETLIATYTRAVSMKDEALFLTLLLNKDIPFSGAGAAIRASNSPDGTHRYSDFHQGVFAGAPFTQHFRNVHIAQDGPLADVTLVYINQGGEASSWGWKTMQLLKVDGHWKIASELFTGHPGAPEISEERR